jgi:hypothetical protein
VVYVIALQYIAGLLVWLRGCRTAILPYSMPVAYMGNPYMDRKGSAE